MQTNVGFTDPCNCRECARNRMGPSRSAYESKYIWDTWIIEHYLSTIYGVLGDYWEVIKRTFTAHIPRRGSEADRNGHFC